MSRIYKRKSLINNYYRELNNLIVTNYAKGKDALLT